MRRELPRDAEPGTIQTIRIELVRMMYYLPFVAAVATFLLLKMLLSSRAAHRISDVPNERSLHSAPIPRIGGVGLIAGVLFAWLFQFDLLVWWLLAPLLMLFAVSLLDDAHNLPVRWRLLSHLLAASAVVWGSGLLSQNFLIGLPVLFLVVWMTNLYNFMDGSDGLAGGMAFFGFAAYGVAAWAGGQQDWALLNFSVSAAALAFLMLNFHPAKVFMGDAGSISLGFMSAAMGLWGWRSGLWPFWFPPLVFAPFVLDASVTLLKRGMRGEKVWQAHREHYYQRLIQMGFGHRNTALVEYGLMLAVAMSGVGLLYAADWVWLVILAWGMFFAALMLWLDRRWASSQKK